MTSTSLKTKTKTKTKKKSLTKLAKMPKHDQHIPVLLKEVVAYLSPVRGDRYLDLTAGYGGHATDILQETKSSAVLVDRDANAQDVLKSMFGYNQRIILIQKSFEQACIELCESSEKFDVILADLGISSPHIDKKERGFSLKLDGPLDMRMDQNQELTAEKVLNSYSEEDLVRILKKYGEEPKAKRIAQAIVQARPVTTTGQLASIVKAQWPGYSKVHPATRTFQALRIEVNDELGQLERSLPMMVDLLEKGGRLGIITFHSLEDRIVKHFFKEKAHRGYDATLELITRKPVVPTQEELVHNPRSRSAKLRVAKRK